MTDRDKWLVLAARRCRCRASLLCPGRRRRASLLCFARRRRASLLCSLSCFAAVRRSSSCFAALLVARRRLLRCRRSCLHDRKSFLCFVKENIVSEKPSPVVLAVVVVVVAFVSSFVLVLVAVIVTCVVPANVSHECCRFGFITISSRHLFVAAMH